MRIRQRLVGLGFGPGFGLGLGLGLALAPAPAVALSLDQCLALARRNAPVLQAATADVTRAGEAVREARSAFAPTLRLGASYVQNNEAPKAVFDIPGAPSPVSHQVIKLGSANTVDVKAETQYMLYSGGRDPALLRAAQATERARSSARAQAEADLVLRVSQAYYRELSAGRLLAAAGDALAGARSHRAVARARVEAGVVPKLDALRAEVDVSQREIAAVRVGEACRMARLELETAMGVALAAAETLEEPAPPGAGLPDSAVALASALAARPEIATLQREIEAALERREAARAGHRPQLALTGTAEYRAPNKNGDYADFANPGLKTYNLSAGVGLSMPLFDAGVVEARVAGLGAERAVLEARQRQAVLEVQREVSRALSGLRVASTVWAANESRLSSAREALRLAEVSYKEGTATATEVRDAETALADARAEEAQSLMDYWSARAEFDHATGARPAREGE